MGIPDWYGVGTDEGDVQTFEDIGIETTIKHSYFSICLFAAFFVQLRSLVIHTPRYSYEFTSSSCFPSTVKVANGSDRVIICLHFETFKLSMLHFIRSEITLTSR